METNLSDKENLNAFLENIERREDWLTVIKFGLPTLLRGDQLFFVELIAKRAEKESLTNGNGQNIVGYFAGIFDDLGLKFIALGE